jgi:hypothetical protein
MAWLRNPRKKIQSILIKIEKGRVSRTDIASLNELLDKEQSAEVVGVLADILKRENTNAYSSVIMALNMMAEKEPELVADSLDAIMSCIRKGEKEIPQDWIPGSLDILFKISLKYPEKMSIAISDLVMCLENISASAREKCYFLLALLAIMKPGVFRGHSKELLRVLNGLNIDERIYACRLIKKIAESDPEIVESTYDVLEDLRLNHFDSNLRSEAAYAVEMLKVKENIIKHKPPGLINSNKVQSEKRKKFRENHLTNMFEASNIPLSELVSIIAPSEEEIKEILIGWGLDHLIRKK